MNVQSILFGWSVVALLCPAVLTAQQFSGANRIDQPAEYVTYNQEVIPEPHRPTIVFPQDQNVPIVRVQSAPVASCTGCNHGCRSSCAVSRCGAHNQCRGCLSTNQSFATPFGASMQQILATQVSKGSLAQMVFYNLHFMYRDGHWELSPAGYDHAVTVCSLMSDPTNGVLVESTGSAQVDEQRRHVVFEQLNAQGCAIQMQQVHVGKPRRLGITGPEALIIYQGRLGRVANPSLGGSYSGGTGGSSSGSSFGSSFSGISSSSGSSSLTR